MLHSFRSSHILALLLFATSALCRGNVIHTGYAERNFATISKIYETTTYPNNIAFHEQGSSSVPAGLFNANASGRVTPLGNFTGFEESTEYFFALSPIPGETGAGIIRPNLNAFTSFHLTSFVSQCPEVSASVVYLRNTVYNPGAANHGKYVTDMKEVAFWRFDKQGAVLHYDAWVPNLPLWFEKFTGADVSGVGLVSVLAQKAIVATAICPQIQDRCKGGNRQYSSTMSCIWELSLKPFGSFDEVWGDNVACRMVHLLLTKFRPEIHCKHVGPSGGGKCVDIDYNEEYIANDKILFGENAFICPP